MWHVSTRANHSQQVSELEIASGLAQGWYNPQTMVWRDGFAEWLPIEQSELRRYVSQSTPKPPPSKNASPLAHVMALLIICLICVFLLRNPPSSSDAPQSQSAQLGIDKSEETQKKRLALISGLQKDNIFADIRTRETGATIMVDVGFYLVDFKAKQDFVSVVFAYYADDRDYVVSLRDNNTNKKVGMFTVSSGLQLD